MKEITLTQGKVAIVDDEDFPELSKHKWYAINAGSRFYAGRTIYQNGSKKNILMHRVILAANQDVDHKDGDGLNNTKENLRECSTSQNIANQRVRLGPKSSLFKGVHFSKKGRTWLASIKINGKRTWLGSYRTEVEAAITYNRAAVLLFGEFAKTNSIPAASMGIEPSKLKKGHHLYGNRFAAKKSSPVIP